MKGGGDDRATGSMSGKVMASRKAGMPNREFGMAPLNSGGNPSQTNGNSPPKEPKIHGLLGPSQVAPFFPPSLGKLDDD